MLASSSSNREPVIAGVVLGFASSILSWTGIATVVATRSRKRCLVGLVPGG